MTLGPRSKVQGGTKGGEAQREQKKDGFAHGMRFRQMSFFKGSPKGELKGFPLGGSPE